MSDETILVLGDLVIPVGSGRNITQTLQPIDNGDTRRTINGTLLDLTREQNRKFESQISTSDMSTPTLAGIWKGSIVSVSCIQELRQHINPASTTVTLIRDPVVASIQGYDATGAKVATDTVVGRDVTFLSAAAYVEFRPILNMMVLSWSTNDDEYGAEEGWTIDLEEV